MDPDSGVVVDIETVDEVQVDILEREYIEMCATESSVPLEFPAESGDNDYEVIAEYRDKLKGF